MRPEVLSKLAERVGQLAPDELQVALLRLLRERTAFESIFQASREGVVVLDESARIEFYNAAAARLIGLGESGAVGAPLSRFVKDLDWVSILGEGVTSRELEVTYPERRLLRVYAVPLGETTARHGSALLFHDATETRQAVQDAAESERTQAVTALAAGVAHEIGNPLNSFSIQLQLMRRRIEGLMSEVKPRRGKVSVAQEDLSGLRGSVEIASREVERLDGILKQFLSAVRPSAAQMRPVEINRLVRESADFFKAEIADRELLLEMELAKGLPPVQADPDQIKQVFFNLITNAVHAMRTRGILHLSTRSAPDGVVVAVRDTGGGISEDVMARLFEPYYTTKSSGTGLGLVIVRRIVHEHGGTIEMDSRVGRGTEVRVKLPPMGSRVKLLPAR